MKRLPYLRSKLRRGRWFHTYRRDVVETSLGVHGLHPTDPRVFAAYCAEHARWEDRPPGMTTPKMGTFRWAVDLYLSSAQWGNLASGTRKSRMAILTRYIAGQGDRPLATITTDDLQAAMAAKGGHAAVNEFKALRPVFAYAKGLGFISSDPTRGVELVRPEGAGFATASAGEIGLFQARWPVNTVERLIFDLALYTGAARVDLARLGRKHLDGGLLVYVRQKSGIEANVPVMAELRAVIARTPDISPTFILGDRGKPMTPESLGNRFRAAAIAAGIDAGLHGLRKAFYIYWAEKNKTTHQIAAMAGHMSLSEVEPYTRAADRRSIVRQIVEGA